MFLNHSAAKRRDAWCIRNAVTPACLSVAWQAVLTVEIGLFDATGLGKTHSLFGRRFLLPCRQNIAGMLRKRDWLGRTRGRHIVVQADQFWFEIHLRPTLGKSFALCIGQ